jgi:hypothetical protein
LGAVTAGLACVPAPLQALLDETPGIQRKIAAVAPKVPPDRERRGELRVDDGGGEAFEGDDPAVIVGDEHVEDRLELDGAGAQIAAVALTNVGISEVRAAPLDRTRDVSLLDVHVIRVKVDHYVWSADLLDQLDRCIPRVDEVALVAVHRLEADRDARFGCAFCRSTERLHAVPAADRRRWLRVLAHGAIDHATEVSRPHVTRNADGIHQQHAPATHRIRILARDIGVERQAQRACRAKVEFPEHAHGHPSVDGPWIEQGDLDEIEASLGAHLNRRPAFALGPTTDEDERVDAELIASRCHLLSTS